MWRYLLGKRKETRGTRAIIIGLDGVSHGLLRILTEKKVMSNVSDLISECTFKKMNSSTPEISMVAWSSIITGKNPAEHGIFGFVDLFPHSYKIKFPNYRDLKVPPFWENKEGVIILNVPATYPVRPVRGVHISGFVSVDLEKSVYPRDLIPLLKRVNYRLDVDSELAHRSIDLFLNDLFQTLEARIKIYRFLWNKFNWKIFMFVFTGTDRLMHFLWNAFEEDYPYKDAFLNYFQRIDKVIGEIYGRITPKDLFFMISDHGFERLEKDVYVNFFLKEQGFLNFKNDKLVLANIDSSTKAFALDPARIYVNLKGRYPAGSVDISDREKVLNDLETMFVSWEIGGRKVIKNIYRKEEIYFDPYIDQAPDLVLIGNRGFNLKAALATNKIADRGIFTGKHSQSDGFLLINRKITKDNPDVFEVVPLIEKFMDDG